jgi:hypothetical protein
MKEEILQIASDLREGHITSIKEKIKREYQDLKPKIKEEPTPF